jgi:hypothetical protein
MVEPSNFLRDTSKVMVKTGAAMTSAAISSAEPSSNAPAGPDADDRGVADALACIPGERVDTAQRVVPVGPGEVAGERGVEQRPDSGRDAGGPLRGVGATDASRRPGSSRCR